VRALAVAKIADVEDAKAAAARAVKAGLPNSGQLFAAWGWVAGLGRLWNVLSTRDELLVGQALLRASAPLPGPGVSRRDRERRRAMNLGRLFLELAAHNARGRDQLVRRMVRASD
jgi:hypothetical protein